MVIRKEPPHHPGCGLAGSPLMPHCCPTGCSGRPPQPCSLSRAPAPGFGGEWCHVGETERPTELKIRRLERGSVGKTHPGHNRESGENPSRSRACALCVCALCARGACCHPPCVETQARAPRGPAPAVGVARRQTTGLSQHLSTWGQQWLRRPGGGLRTYRPHSQREGALGTHAGSLGTLTPSTVPDTAQHSGQGWGSVPKSLRGGGRGGSRGATVLGTGHCRAEPATVPRTVSHRCYCCAWHLGDGPPARTSVVPQTERPRTCCYHGPRAEARNG